MGVTAHRSSRTLSRGRSILISSSMSRSVCCGCFTSQTNSWRKSRNACGSFPSEKDLIFHLSSAGFGPGCWSGETRSLRAGRPKIPHAALLEFVQEIPESTGDKAKSDGPVGGSMFL